MDTSQTPILKNQIVIINLLCEVALTIGINTDNVPKEEKRKREDTDRKREQANKKEFEDKCKRNAKDAMKDGNGDDGDNQPLIKRVRLAGYRRTSSTTPTAEISTSTISQTPSEGSEKGKKVHNSESITDQSLRLKMEVVKELDSGVDIDLKEIGFVKPEKESTRSEKTKSFSMKTISAVSSK